MSGMRRGERTEAMRQDERRKSGLLLEARLARDARRYDESAHLFGEAARLEESLAEAYAAQEIAEQAYRHRFSAADCWAQAGNFLRALELCDGLTQALDTPDTLKARAAQFAAAVRERRDRLWRELSPAA